MDLQYNGHAFSKRFSRELIALMCADAALAANAASGIDWRRSSRRRLRVRDARVFQCLQRCSERYFWPDGRRFWCQARRRAPRRPSPPRASTPRADEAALEDYARAHGYDREDGELSFQEELSPVRKEKEEGERSPLGRLSSLVVVKK